MPRPLLLSLALGCAGAPEPSGEPVQPPEAPETDTPAPQEPAEPVEPTLPAYTPLDPLRLLVRASLDLRGVRPSLAEIARVDADPAALDGLIDSFFFDPRFGRRVREVFDEVLLIRDEAPFVAVDKLDTPWPEEAIWEAIGEEPSRMLERIANDDLPYSAFVTADWTMVNEVTAALLPTDYPYGATGWRVARYIDGRPAAGMLVSSGLWWQHGSTVNNQNRGRANQISRILLCFDYLDSEIDFTGITSLDSEAALGAAIRNDPGCAACHASLDPLASLLYGFWFPLAARNDLADIRTYHPERERLWADYGGLPPAFHGEAVQGLADLGRRIAEEDAYARCFVQRSWEGLLRRPPLPEEAPWVTEALAAFREGGLHIRDAWRAIVRSGAWRNGAGELAPKIATPAVLSSAVEELTGFRWTEGGWDLLRGPMRGYGPAAGGIDGNLRSEGLTEPTATLVLVQAQLAAMAASYVAYADLADPPRARLLTRVDGTETLETHEAALRAQLVDLHLRVAADRVQPDDPRLTAELALWDELFDASGEPAVAWTAILTVLLRDPHVVSY
jgi:hypothetical protein